MPRSAKALLPALGLALLVAGAPLARPGTDADPEIRDQPNDWTLDRTGLGFVSSPTVADPFAERVGRALDVVFAHFESDGETLRGVIQVSEIPPAGDDLCDRCAWGLSWKWENRSYAIYLVRSPSSEAPSRVFDSKASFGHRLASAFEGDLPYAEIRPIEFAVQPGGSRILLAAPLGSLPGLSPGMTLNGTFAETHHLGGAGPGATWASSDRGPDCGRPDSSGSCTHHGRNFSIPASSPPAATAEDPPSRNATDRVPGAAPGNATRTEGAGDAGTASPGGNLLRGGLLVAGGATGVVLTALLVLATLRLRTERSLRERALRTSRAPLARVAEAERELASLAKAASDERSRLLLSRRGHARVLATIGEARAAVGAARSARSATSGAREAASSDPRSRYRVLRALPEGAFGSARLAEDTRLGRRVVIKTLHQRWRLERKVVAAFLREARIAGHLSHPHIVTVYDVHDEGPEPAIIMEYVEGGSLDDRLKRGPLPPADALRLADEILSGLERIHAEGIFHRDLKPENVLLTRDGHAKIADFGIAHAPADADLRLSSSGQQPGTPLYMAPEQVLGEPSDGRTDLYAVGALLHEMLTGKRYLGPVARDFDLRKAIVERPPRLDPSVPAGLAGILRKALAKRREERFASATEMRSALDRERRAGAGAQATGLG